MGLRRTISALVIALHVWGCGYYSSSLLAPAPDGGTSAGASAGAAGNGPGTCEHASPPDKPSVTHAGGDLDLVLALSSIQYSTDPDAGPGSVGYDIDRTCTCQGEKESCLLPSWALQQQCDGPQGRDNSGGLLLEGIAGYVESFGQDRWNTELNLGRWNTLARIRNYNGLADDDEIEMSFYVAASYWANNHLPDGGDAHPKWDGTDVWPVSSASLEPIPDGDGGTTYDVNRPISTDTKAYVSGGVAVGMVAHGILQVDPSLQLMFTDMYVTGKLVKTAQGWEIQDGTLAGVWTLDDLFNQLGYMDVAGMGMCMGNQIYGIFKKMVCQRTDIYRSRGTPTTPCDSISIGMSFNAKPVHLGGVIPPYNNTKKCPPDKDPSLDSCDKP